MKKKDKNEKGKSRKIFLKTCILFLFLPIFLAEGCTSGQSQTRETETYQKLTLFSDVTHWNMPKWSFEDGSITKTISEKTGVAFNFQIPAMNADKMLSRMLLEDKLPDVIAVTDETVVRQLIDSGKVWKLDELLEMYCPDSHLLTKFPEDVKKTLIKRYGGWYTYPSNMNSADTREIWKPTQYYSDYLKYGENTAVMWNRKIMEMAGITEADLQTEDQVIEALKKVNSLNLTVHGKKVVPLLWDGTSYQGYSFQYLNNTFGAERVDDEGNYQDIWTQPQSKETLRFCNLSFREGYSKKEYLTYDNEQIRDLIAKDCVFCFIGNVSNTGSDAREWISTGAIYSALGDKPVLSGYQASYGGWMKTLISKECKNPQAAARFLDYMTSDEGMLQTNYGEENVDFYYDQDGLIRRTELGEQKYEEKRQTGMSMWWNFVNNIWEYSVLPEPDAETAEGTGRELRIQFGKESYIYDLSLFDVSDQFWEAHPEEKELNDKISNYQKEQILKIITAESEEDFEQEYQIFQEKMKELGIEKLEKVLNENLQENCRYYGEKVERINKTS